MFFNTTTLYNRCFFSKFFLCVLTSVPRAARDGRKKSQHLSFGGSKCEIAEAHFFRSRCADHNLEFWGGNSREIYRLSDLSQGQDIALTQRRLHPCFLGACERPERDEPRLAPWVLPATRPGVRHRRCRMHHAPMGTATASTTGTAGIWTKNPMPGRTPGGITTCTWPPLPEMTRVSPLRSGRVEPRHSLWI